jgi:glutamate/tyrosine decarboxylase-like PLP-dependent enzyme
MKLPRRGVSGRRILAALDAFKAKDIDWRSGRVFGYIYDPGPRIRRIAERAYRSFLTENGLDFTSFPSLLRLENELVGFGVRHLRGGPGCTGNFTSGGTESILLAVKAARDGFRGQHRGRAAPEIILPHTAHAAFHKAADYLGLRVVPVAVDRGFRADPRRIRRALSPRTALIVCSAPSYAHGVIDPVAPIAAIARRAGVRCHVDACVGGFLLPFYRRLGLPVPDFDFAVPGVTSISMDLHKYGYTPKGASLVLHRDAALRRPQIFTCARWSGYAVVNAAVQSSKSGGPLAAAWATLQAIGEAGYLEIARRSHAATERLTEGIRRTPGLALTAEPDFCMVSFRTTRASPFTLAALMNRRGWYVQPQLGFAGSPPNIHLSITFANTAWVERFLADLAACERAAAAGPPLAAGREFRKAWKRRGGPLAPHAAVMELCLQAVAAHGEAAIHDILNAMEPEAREAFITDYANAAFRPDPET